MLVFVHVKKKTKNKKKNTKKVNFRFIGIFFVYVVLILYLRTQIEQLAVELRTFNEFMMDNSIEHGLTLYNDLLSHKERLRNTLKQGLRQCRLNTIENITIPGIVNHKKYCASFWPQLFDSSCQNPQLCDELTEAQIIAH